MFVTEEVLFNGKAEKGFHNKSSQLLSCPGERELKDSGNMKPALLLLHRAFSEKRMLLSYRCMLLWSSVHLFIVLDMKDCIKCFSDGQL